MRKSDTVQIKLDDKNVKKFTVNELTVEEILELLQSSSVSQELASQSGADDPDGKKVQEEKQDDDIVDDSVLGGLVELAAGIGADMQRIMVKSCDFTIEDLKPLAPSDIRKIWDKYKEVNSDFLGTLKALGIMEAIQEYKEATLSSFSKVLVDSLRADT
jgi:hypothetical protein